MSYDEEFENTFGYDAYDEGYDEDEIDDMLWEEETKQAKSNGTLNNQSAGCYIATAVYGSYDCPEVWTLRRYRDKQLAKTWYGRMFIRTYYAISPTLVKWFGETQWFKNMCKSKLDKMVYRLQKEGIDNTPYQDGNW